LSGTDIFISYSREDHPAARQFATCFAEEGFSVWWDNALHSGETFDEVIEKQLKESKAVVVLWSPRSVASRWVRAEATLADRRNKLCPAIIEACDRPIAFELTHTADLSHWGGDGSDPRWKTFILDLHRLVQRGREAQAQAEAPQDHSPAPEAKVAAAAPVPDPVKRVDAIDARPPTSRIGGRAETAVPAAGEEFHCLELLDPQTALYRFVVSPMGIKIGRTAPADIVLADSSVSREHCIVGLANDELLVSDLSSTNGTYIDGVRIGRAAVLPVGSVLRAGKVAMSHEIRTRAELESGIDPTTSKRESGARPVRVAIST
jgi:hypothetical protein